MQPSGQPAACKPSPASPSLPLDVEGAAPAVHKAADAEAARCRGLRALFVLVVVVVMVVVMVVVVVLLPVMVVVVVRVLPAAGLAGFAAVVFVFVAVVVVVVLVLVVMVVLVVVVVVVTTLTRLAPLLLVPLMMVLMVVVLVVMVVVVVVAAAAALTRCAPLHAFPRRLLLPLQLQLLLAVRLLCSCHSPPQLALGVEVGHHTVCARPKHCLQRHLVTQPGDQGGDTQGGMRGSCCTTGTSDGIMPSLHPWAMMPAPAQELAAGPCSSCCSCRVPVGW